MEYGFEKSVRVASAEAGGALCHRDRARGEWKSEVQRRDGSVCSDKEEERERKKK